MKDFSLFYINNIPDEQLIAMSRLNKDLFNSLFIYITLASQRDKELTKKGFFLIN
jgi:hypothetical protein